MSERAERELQLPDAAAVRRTLARWAAAGEAPWLHAEVARRMAERLVVVRRQPEVVLDWWSRSGAGAGELRHRYPRARRIAVEPRVGREGVVAQPHRRGWFDRWRREPAEAQGVHEEDVPPSSADLVWSNMSLHWQCDPPALFARWLEALRVDGFVMLSGFGPGSLPELREVYRRHGWGSPAHGGVDMHDLGDMLVHAGFADPVMDQELIQLRWNDTDALLAELRALGGNASRLRPAGLRTPAWHQRFRAALDDLRGSDGRIGLSFEVVYGHAFKAARARAGDSTTISLEDMRGMVRRGRA